jgi:hypothetical protein
MSTTSKPSVGTSGAPGHKGLTEDPQERELDEALAETFPASDPIAVSGEPADSPDDEIDQALEDTFPASDPPSTTQPGSKQPDPPRKK